MIDRNCGHDPVVESRVKIELPVHAYLPDSIRGLRRDCTESFR